MIFQNTEIRIIGQLVLNIFLEYFFCVFGEEFDMAYSYVWRYVMSLLITTIN